VLWGIFALEMIFLFLLIIRALQAREGWWIWGVFRKRLRLFLGYHALSGLWTFFK
jgi:hypothetical protein